MTVSLPAIAECGAVGGISTPDGRALSNASWATVIDPVGISVADARAEVGAGAVLTFAITLDRAATSAFSADCATTSERTAHAGGDYARRAGR